MERQAGAFRGFRIRVPNWDAKQHALFHEALFRHVRGNSHSGVGGISFARPTVCATLSRYAAQLEHPFR
jgi:hypothetical protein